MNILIVGGGRMGAARATFLSRKGGYNVVLVEPDSEIRAKLLIELPMISIADSILDAIAVGVDVAFICTPPNLHYENAIQCVEACLSTFIEKPSTLTYQDGVKLAARAKELGVHVVVGYHNRIRPSVLELKQRIETCDVLGFAGWWVCGAYARDWWHHRASSGGALFEQACHLVDLVGLLFGRVVEFNGRLMRRNGAVETAAMWLRSDRGVGGGLFYSSEAREKDIALRVFTTTTTFELRGWELSLLVDDVLVAPFQGATQRNAVFEKECGEFLSQVRTGASMVPLASLEDALLTEDIVRKLSNGGGDVE